MGPVPPAPPADAAPATTAPNPGRGGRSRPDRAARPLVIVGPTASGKSSLALEVAAAVPGAELVSVDSMQVYRGMDIGTASPTPAERAAVPHHLIDLVDPAEEFTVVDFQAAARKVLADLASRGAVPILVGGTGLYLRAVIDELEIPPRYPELAAELDAEVDTAALHRRLAALDPPGAARMEPTNRRRVLRALEVTLGSGRPFSSFGPGLDTYPAVPYVQIGLRWPRDELDRRIAARYRRQLRDGFLDEVRTLSTVDAGAGEGTGLSRTAAQALGYKELLAHVRGECSLEEAVEEAIVRTRRFARRQERWFRRDPRIHWIDMPVDAAEVLAHWDRAPG